MSANLLIPFGISYATAEIIEPEDAPRGRACNCYCPGCEMPLLARHPSERENKKIYVRHHFAHDSSHPEAKQSVIDECPFNGELAFAIMARHLAQQFIGGQMLLPALTLMEFGEYGRVTDKKHLEIDGIETEVMALGHKFDFKINFGQHNVLVWLSYDKGRRMPDIQDEVRKQMNNVGVLEIKVSRKSLYSFREYKGRFSDFVKSFFLEDGYRLWVYHPKEDAVKQKGRDVQQKLYLRSRNTFQAENYERQRRNSYELVTTPSSQSNFVPHKATCRQCNAIWEHTEQGPYQCPNGHSHLFCTRIA